MSPRIEIKVESVGEFSCVWLAGEGWGDVGRVERERGAGGGEGERGD